MVADIDDAITQVGAGQLVDVGLRPLAAFWKLAFYAPAGADIAVEFWDANFGSLLFYNGSGLVSSGILTIGALESFSLGRLVSGFSGDKIVDSDAGMRALGVTDQTFMWSETLGKAVGGVCRLVSASPTMYNTGGSDRVESAGTGITSGYEPVDDAPRVLSQGDYLFFGRYPA